MKKHHRNKSNSNPLNAPDAEPPQNFPTAQFMDKKVQESLKMLTSEFYWIIGILNTLQNQQSESFVQL